MSSNTLFRLPSWIFENLENAANRVEPAFTGIN